MLLAATAATTLGATRHGPSRDRRIHSTDRTDRPRLGSSRIDAAAGRSARTSRPRPGRRPSRADRIADKGWAQQALAAAISFRQT